MVKGVRVQIRDVSETEHPALQALLRSAYKAVLARLSAEDAETFSQSFEPAIAKYAARGTWLAMVREESLAGCVAYFKPFATKHPLFQGNCAHVQLLGVSPEETRKQIGRGLMLHCMSRAKTDGANQMLLQTSELMPEARRLYESLGFSIRQPLPSVWGQPTYLYGRLLNNAGSPPIETPQPAS